MTRSSAAPSPLLPRRPSPPTPRRDAVHLLVVSRTFYDLALPLFFRSITIASTPAWAALFDPAAGLLVAGPLAERRRLAVEEVCVDRRVFPPATVTWTYDAQEDGFSLPQLVVAPLSFPELLCARSLVVHCPRSLAEPGPMNEEEVDALEGWWLASLHKKKGWISKVTMVSEAISALARTPFDDLFNSLPILRAISYAANENESATGITSMMWLVARASGRLSIHLASLDVGHPRRNKSDETPWLDLIGHNLGVRGHLCGVEGDLELFLDQGEKNHCFWTASDGMVHSTSCLGEGDCKVARFLLCSRTDHARSLCSPARFPAPRRGLALRWRPST